MPGRYEVVRKRVVLEPPPTAPVAVDPYLSEFALFAQDGLTINAGAGIGKWNKSPEARGADPRTEQLPQA